MKQSNKTTKGEGSSREELRARIQSYLEMGGLYNPELMEHTKVRDLLLDCKRHLTQVEENTTNKKSIRPKVLKSKYKHPKGMPKSIWLVMDSPLYGVHVFETKEYADNQIDEWIEKKLKTHIL